MSVLQPHLILNLRIKKKVGKYDEHLLSSFRSVSIVDYNLSFASFSVFYVFVCLYVCVYVCMSATNKHFLPQKKKIFPPVGLACKQGNEAEKVRTRKLILRREREREKSHLIQLMRK